MDIISSSRHKWRNYANRTAYIIAFFALLCLNTFLSYGIAKADDEKIKVKEINYNNSTITLRVNDKDTQVYVSNSLKKTWDTIEGDISSNNTIKMDISWISASSNYTLCFKGNHSTDITKVVIPKQVSNFRAKFDKAKSTIKFSNYGTRTIEWKKKNSSTWNTVNVSSISKELSYLYSNGATVMFRLAPVNGTSNTDVGCRPSKEISITIPKKASAPPITINGSKFIIPVKGKTAYRTKEADGTTSNWTTLNTSKNLLLKDIASEAMYTSASATQKEVTLQFRTNASSSSQVSNITTVVVPIQEGPPSADKYGISLKYTSSSTCSLQVKAASTTVPFEYTIVKADEELNYQSCSWTSITSSSAISISSTAAPKGCHIYVRKKSIEASENVDFALASAELDVTSASSVTYPDALVTSKLTTLITTAGVCRTNNTSKYLTFTLYSPIETTVSSVDFYDTYGNKKGSVATKSTVASNTNGTGTDDKYIITTKITSTENVDNVTKEKLYAKIIMTNTDTIMSTDTSGVILYLYPNTVVNNPTTDDDYTSNFSRIYMSKETTDNSSFKFRLDLGTDKVIDASAVESYTSEATAISSISFNGYTLVKDTDYKVIYGSYVNEDGTNVPSATVTVNISEFEKTAASSSIMDKAEPLKITLNNGEILNNSVNIKLVSTATIDNMPIAWSIMEGSLKETETKTETDTSGNKTTVTKDVVTYTITLTLSNKSYGVGISDVTWGGISILGSSTVSGGKATIYLSNAKINKLTTASTTTNNIVITLSNGYVISSGCKLTIIDAK